MIEEHFERLTAALNRVADELVRLTAAARVPAETGAAHKTETSAAQPAEPEPEPSAEPEAAAPAEKSAGANGAPTEKELQTRCLALVRDNPSAREGIRAYLASRGVGVLRELDADGRRGMAEELFRMGST